MTKQKVSVFFLSVFCLVSILSAQVTAQNTKELLKSSLPLPHRIEENPHLKVLLQETDSFTLTIPTAFRIEAISGSSILRQGSSLPPSKVTIQDKGIQIGKVLFPHVHLKVSTNNQFFQIDKKQYHDIAHIVVSPGGKLLIINEIGLEDYLKGVLPWEVSEKWPEEALRAQAVVARTFALFKMQERAGQPYVLTSDVMSQVYVGRSAEKQKTNQAVDFTRGEVLVYQNKLFPAFFHAACGGQTTKADFVWRIQPNPVLNGTLCSFCKGSKHDVWETDISFEKIESKIRERGYTMSPIQNILFSDYDPTGRAKKVVIEHQKGTLVLDSNDFRIFVDPDDIRSTKSSASVRNQRAYLHGNGWGHGVGMCQWGMKGQADTGKKFEQILMYYYPGSKIQKIYGAQPTVKTEPVLPGTNQDNLFDKVEQTMNEWFG